MVVLKIPFLKAMLTFTFYMEPPDITSCEHDCEISLKFVYTQYVVYLS